MSSSEKPLGKGSVAPGAVPEGRIRLYSAQICPYAHRSRLVLHVKGIKHDIVNIDLKDKPDWFLMKNPLGLVPVMETPAGQVIYESPIVCDYLDEVYPGIKLLPADPFEKAQQRMLLEHFSKVTPSYYKILMMRRSGEDTAKAEEELKEKLIKLNKHLVGKKYFGGDSITMIDYMIWPWFERMEAFGLKHCMDGAIELKSWTERMLVDPSVKATMADSETYKAYYSS
ncbi:hypothetical protein GJAV_G00238700 [Gymnothorax javanicus]|nr:hypothetical protein GJAV_G00238700 [Gymnothorax javanicus]